MWLGIIITVVTILFVLAAIVGAVVLVVRMAKNKKNPMQLTVQSLLRAYLYLATFVTLVAMISGASLVLKAGASYVFGYPFSYDVSDYSRGSEGWEPYDYNSDTISYQGEKYSCDLDDRRRDLINGISLFISMAILFAMHRGAIHYTDKEKDSLPKKIYLFGGLISFSLVSIITIPASIYSILTFYLYDIENLTAYSRENPGEPLSIALVSLPLWLIFLLRLLNMRPNAKTSKRTGKKK